MKKTWQICVRAVSEAVTRALQSQFFVRDPYQQGFVFSRAGHGSIAPRRGAQMFYDILGHVAHNVLKKAYMIEQKIQKQEKEPDSFSDSTMNPRILQ